ncbi:hypothetical protein Efla_005951 [Eimeria flavescens]
MAASPLRPLAAGGRPTLKNLHAKAEVYVHLSKRAHALRQQLFGYAKGLPGEAEWLKPLKGRRMMEYYWPSKHDLPSFHMDQYFKMQALRHAPKETHPSLLSLARLLTSLISKKQQVRALLSRLDSELLSQNPTLQDLHALYKSIFPDDPLKGVVPEEQHWQWADALHPHTLLALLEMSFKLRGEEKKFESVLEEARACRTEEDLQRTLKLRLGTELHAAVGPALLFLSTENHFLLPAPCCSYEVSCDGWETSSFSTSHLQQQQQQHHVAESEDRARCTARLLSLTAAAKQQQQPQQQPQQEPALEAAANRTPKRKAHSRHARQTAASAAAADREGAVGLGLLGPPRVQTVRVGLKMEETQQQQEQREQQQQAAALLLQQEVTKDPRLAGYLGRQHRFVDPLFKRRRVSFLDRLARSRIKSQHDREIRSQVYVQHPDNMDSFPNNKGFLTRKWPSPYH